MSELSRSRRCFCNSEEVVFDRLQADRLETSLSLSWTRTLIFVVVMTFRCGLRLMQGFKRMCQVASRRSRTLRAQSSISGAVFMYCAGCDGPINFAARRSPIDSLFGGG